MAHRRSDRPFWVLVALIAVVVPSLACADLFCTTTCDDLTSRLVDECGLGDGEEIACKDDEECADGTHAACIARCGLDAPCGVFDGTLDYTDEQDIETVVSYAECTADC